MRRNHSNWFATVESPLILLYHCKQQIKSRYIIIDSIESSGGPCIPVRSDGDKFEYCLHVKGREGP
jgi:hypothetical protein